MSSPSRSTNGAKFGVALATLLGIGLIAALVAYSGAAAVRDALLAAGWQGLAAMAAVHLIPLFLMAYAWRVLFEPPPRAGLWVFAWARWIRDGTNLTLALMPLSGEVISGRVIARHGVSPAGASVMVDMTCELLSQVLYACIGVAALIVLLPGNPAVFWAAAGVVVTALAFLGFLVAQIAGLFKPVDRLLDKIGRSRLGLPVPTTSGELHDAIVAMYRKKARIIAGIAVHLAAWLMGMVEVWVALRFMGHPLGLAEILAIETVFFSWRSVGFFVPWNVGIQEGSYVLLGAAMGLTPDVAVALSLMKRVRDLLFGVPATLAWQVAEGGQLWASGLQRQPVRSRSGEGE